MINRTREAEERALDAALGDADEQTRWSLPLDPADPRRPALDQQRNREYLRDHGLRLDADCA